jgi:hypothetical protein
MVTAIKIKKRFVQMIVVIRKSGGGHVSMVRGHFPNNRIKDELLHFCRPGEPYFYGKGAFFE